MSGRLEGKVIVIAGAGGIGTGLTRRYAAEGAQVIVGDIDTAGAEAAAEAARAEGGKAVAVTLDGANEEHIRAAVALAQSDFGGLDGFHANYLYPPPADSVCDIVDLPIEDFDDAMRVNLRGYVVCTRHAVPAMIARGGGCMLYTSSGASFEAQPVRAAYTMGKAATNALMRHVATRFGPDGIRANALTPGLVLHPRAVGTVPAEFVDRVVATTPRRRLGEPEDVAAMCAFLMSDDANFVTGQLISVDGGRTMRQ